MTSSPEADHPALKTAQSQLPQVSNPASLVAKVRKGDVGWSEQAGLWLCRALIHPATDTDPQWQAESKDLPGVDAVKGESEAEVIAALKVKLKDKIEGHLGAERTNKVPFVDISLYRGFQAYIKILGVDACPPVKEAT